MCAAVFRIGGGTQRASHCSALSRMIFQQQPWPRPVLVQRSQKIRLQLFSLGASNRIPIPRLLSLSNSDLHDQISFAKP